MHAPPSFLDFIKQAPPWIQIWEVLNKLSSSRNKKFFNYLCYHDWWGHKKNNSDDSIWPNCKGKIKFKLAKIYLMILKQKVLAAKALTCDFELTVEILL